MIASAWRWCAVLLLAIRPAAASDLLDEYVALQVGTFNSQVQARHDARYAHAVWHIAEIWPDGSDGARWLYTESWIDGAPAPYMQRISRAAATADGAIELRRYTLPDPEPFVGAWRETQRFAPLAPAQLTEIEGCISIMARAGDSRFEGGTVGTRCRNDYKGAAYAISRTTLMRDRMTNWDRGFSAAGDLVWGPASGGYEFRRAGSDQSCVDPVRMLVYGEIQDRKAFGAYARALAESGLYRENGGYYEAITPPLAVFEGDPPDNRGVIIARFPCLEAAQRFWNSDAYAAIRRLREGIAEFEVLVLPVPPLPEYVAD
jgi:CpeT protein